jgi:hypothetical protein
MQIPSVMLLFRTFRSYSICIYMCSFRVLHHFKFIYNLILIPFSTMNVYVVSVCCLEGHGGTKERS